MSERETLLSLYNLFPFHRHPMWSAVLAHQLSFEQVLRAEGQHYLRTRAGQSLRERSAMNATKTTPLIFEAAMENYLEEVRPSNGESHLALIERLLLEGGYDSQRLGELTPTPGNAAAIALYRNIAERGPALHVIGAGVVEFYYSQLSPRIFAAYVEHYGMSPHQAETYSLHGPMDATHANRALEAVDEVLTLHPWPEVQLAVRDAFVATSLHYDGMLQAATGNLCYWGGS